MEKVEYLETIVPNAYHGTSKTNADNIIKTGFRNPRAPDLFLGDGIYFYEGSRKLAERWAERKFLGQEIGIIIARIKLGYCLNLTIPEHRELIRDISKEFQKRQWEKVTDAIVINYFASVIEPKIETIKHFHEPEKITKLFGGSRIMNGGYIVICVRKSQCILRFSIAE